MKIGELLLKRFRDNDDTLVYYHLLSCLNKDRLEAIIQEAYDNSKSDEYWMQDFHKQFRQVDVFDTAFKKDTINKLSEQEKFEMSALKTMLNSYTGMTRRQVKEHDSTNYEKYMELYRRSNTVVEESISGNLDMVMYNLIYNDNKDILYKNMMKIFNEYDMILKNIEYED